MNSRESTGQADAEIDELRVAFVDALERGELLGDWLDRYPQHARMLTDLAIALDLDDHEPTLIQEEVDFAAAALREGLAHITDQPPSPASPGLVARATAMGLAVPQLARRLRLAGDILFQIDRGYIRPDSLPQRLHREIATVLKVSIANLPANLVAARAPTAFYYADCKPTRGNQLSFVEALADSEELAEEDRVWWLSVAREEALA
jgi:hypothetical protein